MATQPQTSEHGRRAPSDWLAEKDTLGGSSEPSPEPETLWRRYGKLLLLRRLDSLFFELGRSGRVPFAWPIRGLEALLVGAVEALEPQDWIYPDLRGGWSCAVLRGYPLAEHLHQLLGTAGDRARGRSMPGQPCFAPGRVVGATGQLGTRVHQALGTAWALRQRGERGVAACLLGPGELERPDVLDALGRALELHAPLLCLLGGPKSLVDRWTWTLAGHDVPHAFADGGDVGSVLNVTRKLAGRCRAEQQPAAVVCLEAPATAGRAAPPAPDEPAALDPLERFAESLRAADLLPLSREQQIRRAVHAEVRQALVAVLGESLAHLLLGHLDARDVQLDLF